MAVLSLLAACVSGRVLAVEAVDVGDTYTQAGSANTASGNATTMVVSGSGSTLKRGWIQFDLNSVLPPGTTGSQIGKATLKLWAATATTGGTVNVYAVTGAPWSEDTITHNNAPLVSSTIEGSFAVTTAKSFVTVDLTPLVQDWVNGMPNGLNNYGLVMTPAASTVNVAFDTMESTTTSHGPQLDLVLCSLTSGTIFASQIAGLSAVATSGSYSSLKGVPTIPTNTSQLTNGAGFVTSSGTAAFALSSSNAISLSGMIPASQVNGLAAVATNGGFNSLSGRPTTLAGYGITDPVILSGGTASNLTLTGSATIGGNTTINGAFNVSGTAKLTNSMIVTGSATTTANGITYVAKQGQLVLIPQQGDLSMGKFTTGLLPQ